MYKYIVVDDQSLIRKGILKQLKTFDQGILCVGEANNGEDALKLIQNVDPDIVFTDMRMPVMDGKILLKILQSDYPNIKIIVVSGYADFEYMKEAISANVMSYLLKPFNQVEIHDALSKAISLLEKDRSIQNKIKSIETEKEEISYNTDMQSLCSLILGNHKKENAINIRSSKLKFIETADHYIMLTLYSTEKLALDCISNYIETNSMKNSCLFIAHTLNDQLGFFILLFSQNKETEIAESASRTACSLIKFFNEESTDEAFIGISSMKQGIIKLNEAYKETIFALDNRKITSSNNFSFYTDKKTVLNTIHWDKEEELLFHIESGNTSKVFELTNDYFDFISNNHDLTLHSIKLSCKNLAREIRNVLSIYFDTIHDNSISSSFDLIIDTLFDLNAIRTYFLKILPNIAEMLKGTSIYSAGNMIDNIKTYIQKNYLKELSLERISSLFFINSNYCSTIFKEKTGENFIDYVNKFRIEKAKELLRNTDHKIFRIAKAVGYNNVKYFFRVFKKITRFTPEEYRMLKTD